MGGSVCMCFVSSVRVGDEESTMKKEDGSSLKVTMYSTDSMTEVIECGI